MSKHINAVWPVHEIGKYPNYYVRTEPTHDLAIFAATGNGMQEGFRITRRGARLLARRINQCLDSTK